MIPDFQTVMLPLLKLAGDNVARKRSEITRELAVLFGLTDDELSIRTNSGSLQFDNRVQWSVTYLKKAGLLFYPQRGIVQITPAGISVLKSPPERITIEYLKGFESFASFRSENQETAPENIEVNEITPEETIDVAFSKIQDRLADEILDTVKKCSPAFLENLVVTLVVAMGYGGSRAEAGMAIGATGDEGIDGIINEDKLGLDVIYLQATRWDETRIGRPEIQKFVGALTGKRAKKGIFITTSMFSKEAEEYARNIELKVILIDGPRLARLMIEHNVGVATSGSYEVKKIDGDFFVE